MSYQKIKSPSNHELNSKLLKVINSSFKPFKNGPTYNLYPIFKSAPDFCTDLNAIRQIELILEERGLLDSYYESLDDIVCLNSDSFYSAIDLIMASARFKAEACLQVLEQIEFKCKSPMEELEHKFEFEEKYL